MLCRAVYFKGLVHPKMKISPCFTHPQGIPGVYDILSFRQINPIQYEILANWKYEHEMYEHVQHSILSWGSFCWITAAMRRGMESISLWHCSGVMRAQVALIVAFSSSALLGLAYRIFLFTIPHRFSMGLRSGEFAGQLRTGIPWSLNQVLVALALCAGAKSCWKMKSAFP